MPLTTQEIMQIAKAIADKVVLGTPCACGHTTWDAQLWIGLARASIDTKDKAHLKVVIPKIQDELNKIEKFCAIDMEKTRGMLVALKSEMERETWKEAWFQLDAIFEEIDSRLREAKEKELAESSPKASPEVATSKEKMPRINPHATAIQQDKQLVEQMKWLKAHGFKTPREAQEAGY